MVDARYTPTLPTPRQYSAGLTVHPPSSTLQQLSAYSATSGTASTAPAVPPRQWLHGPRLLPEDGRKESTPGSVFISGEVPYCGAHANSQSPPLQLWMLITPVHRMRPRRDLDTVPIYKDSVWTRTTANTIYAQRMTPSRHNSYLPTPKAPLSWLTTQHSTTAPSISVRYHLFRNAYERNRLQITYFRHRTWYLIFRRKSYLGNNTGSMYTDSV